MIGWIANALLMVGTWLIGSKRVVQGLVVSFFGTVLWLVRAYQIFEPDLLFINLVYLVLIVRAIYTWRKAD